MANQIIQLNYEFILYENKFVSKIDDLWDLSESLSKRFDMSFMVDTDNLFSVGYGVKRNNYHKMTFFKPFEVSFCRHNRIENAVVNNSVSFIDLDLRKYNMEYHNAKNKFDKEYHPYIDNIYKSNINLMCNYYGVGVNKLITSNNVELLSKKINKLKK